jgi:hypothetical protein
LTFCTFIVFIIDYLLFISRFFKLWNTNLKYVKIKGYVYLSFFIYYILNTSTLPVRCNGTTNNKSFLQKIKDKIFGVINFSDWEASPHQSDCIYLSQLAHSDSQSTNPIHTIHDRSNSEVGYGTRHNVEILCTTHIPQGSVYGCKIIQYVLINLKINMI